MKLEKKLKLTFIIAEKSIGSKVNKYLESKGYDKYFSFYAKGSASSVILEYLGIGETEKDVIIYPSNEVDAIKIMDYIKESEFIKKTLLFRVPVSGISSLKSLECFLKEEAVNE